MDLIDIRPRRRGVMLTNSLGLFGIPGDRCCSYLAKVRTHSLCTANDRYSEMPISKEIEFILNDVEREIVHSIRRCKKS